MTASLLLPTTLLPTDAEAWRAVSARDAHYDGRFVYANSSLMRMLRRWIVGSRRYSAGPDNHERATFTLAPGRACVRLLLRSCGAGSRTT